MDASGTINFEDFARFAQDWCPLLVGDFNRDGLVNFLDFARLAKYWRGYDEIVDISIPVDGSVDFNDLSVFTKHWLEGVEP